MDTVSCLIHDFNLKIYLLDNKFMIIITMITLINSLEILDSGACTIKFIVFLFVWLAVGGPRMRYTVLCFSPGACLDMYNFLYFLNSAADQILPKIVIGFCS